MLQAANPVAFCSFIMRPAPRPCKNRCVRPKPATRPSGQAAAGGLALINSIGALGGFAGPYLVGYIKDTFHSFNAGMLALAGVLLITTLLAMSVRLFMKDE